MADDKSTTEIARQEIDLDDIELNILVIAQNPNKLGQATAFLSRRGWPTTAMNSVSKSIEYISEHKPDFVLLSINHQSPATAKLPELLTSTFGTTVVAFAENMDTASGSRLTKSRLKYKIPGQPSGPALHRSIRRFLAERLNINLDDKSDEGSREGKGADRNVTIKGEGRKAADGGAIIQHSSAGPANESGPAHIKGESVTEAEGQSGKEVLSTGKYTMAKRTKRSLKDLLPSGEKAADGGAIASTAAGGNGGGLTGFANDGSDGGKPAQNGGTSGGGNDGTRSAEDLANMLKRTLFGEGKEEPAEQTSPRSVMERVVADAMNDICVPTEKDEVLGRVNRVGVFPVDSNTTPGYLVIALPRSMAKGADEDFLRKVEAAVHRRFKDSGFPGRIETGFWAPIPKISFVDFSAEKSSFSLTVSHEGMQIGAAFFRADKSLPQVKEFDQEDMLSVEIEDISTELPVNFKAYLHLRANRKYFLYLRSGRRFQPEQKERLQNRNVTDFFMKRIDKENLRLFLAESFLRDLVRAFGRKAG